MSREIRFRVWDKESKKMVYREREDYEAVELLQFTGLKDMNGVDIYEGDFIRSLDGVIAIVRFENGVFGCDRKITADFRTNEHHVIHQPVVDYVMDGCEVVGNEYENENLLEDK